MAKYKYKIKEAPGGPNLAKQIGAKVGDVSISKDGDTKFTVTAIDPESGQVSWKVTNLPAFDKLFDDVSELVNTAKGVVVRAKEDEKFRDFFELAKELRNKIRTHLRKEYPDEYQRMTMVGEAIDLVHVYRDGEMFGTGELVKDLGNGKVRVRFDAESEGTFLAKNVKPVKEAFDELDDGYDKKLEDIIKGGIDLHPDELKNVVYYIHNNWMAGNYGDDYAIRRISKFLRENEVEEISTSAGAGSYLTKYAFKKPKKQKELPEGGLEENIAATLGPGPKAGPDGVKDNYYIKKFKYKLVPKDKNGNYVQKGSGLEVKNF